MKRSNTIRWQAASLGGRIFLTLFLGTFFVVGLLMSAAGTYLILFPHFWPEVEIRISRSEIVENGGNSAENGRFKVEVEYAYGFEGQSFKQKEAHTFGDYREAKALADRFVPGATAACHVNPFNPAKSTIDQGPIWMAVFLLIPLCFVAFATAGIYGIWFRGWELGRENSASSATAISRKIPAVAGRAFLLVFFSVFLLAGLVFFGVLFVRPVLKIMQAKNWLEVPCTILSSEVRSYRDSDGNTQHRADIFYRYTFEGEEFRSNQHQFLAMSGDESSRSATQRYPAGSEAVCYVNPNDPSEAVLEREFTTGLLLGLFPLLFVGVGAAGLIWQVKTRGEPPEVSPGLPGLGSVSTAWSSRAKPQLSGAEPFTRSRSRPDTGAAGPVVLKPKHGPWAKFIGTLLVALFWNGIVSVFVFQVVDGWRHGRGEWFLTLFMVPFVLVGIGLIGGVIYSLLALANPRPMLTVTSNIVALGESIEMEWRLSGRVHSLDHLRLSFAGEEEAQYRQGTSTATDIETFAEIELATVTNPFDMRWGKVRLTVPADTMHSLDTGNNKIRWEVRVQGRIQSWPDLNETFPITVRPMPSEERREQSNEQTATGLAR